MRFSNNIFW